MHMHEFDTMIYRWGAEGVMGILLWATCVGFGCGTNDLISGCFGFDG